MELPPRFVGHLIYTTVWENYGKLLINYCIEIRGSIFSRQTHRLDWIFEGTLRGLGFFMRFSILDS